MTDLKLETKADNVMKYLFLHRLQYTEEGGALTRDAKSPTL